MIKSEQIKVIQKPADKDRIIEVYGRLILSAVKYFDEYELAMRRVPFPVDEISVRKMIWDHLYGEPLRMARNLASLVEMTTDIYTANLADETRQLAKTLVELLEFKE